MGAGPIIFDYSRWVLQFPELSGISQASILSVDAAGLPFGYWSDATMYFVNDGSGPINDPVMLANLLYLTTAHVAFLSSPRTNGVPTTGGTEPAPPLVGRINSAAEGSVNVSAEMPNQPAAAAWWQQTPYGAQVWQMIKPFRLMHYVPNPRRRIYNPPVWLRGGGGPGHW
jgi:hypothetical protein